MSDIPRVGDKIICLKNEWDTVTENGDVLVNGTLGYVNDISIKKTRYKIMNEEWRLDVLPDGYAESYAHGIDNCFRKILSDPRMFVEGVSIVNKTNYSKFPAWRRPKEFDYGYCITCHKAQGSEYDKVLVFEEYLRGSNHIEWLYTAATRAKKKLIIVRAA